MPVKNLVVFATFPVTWALASTERASPIVIVALPTLGAILLLQRFTGTKGRLLAEALCALQAFLLLIAVVGNMDSGAAYVPECCRDIPLGFLGTIALLTLALALAEESRALPALLNSKARA